MEDFKKYYRNTYRTCDFVDLYNAHFEMWIAKAYNFRDIHAKAEYFRKIYTIILLKQTLPGDLAKIIYSY